MLIKKADDIRSSEITPRDLYVNRRKFLAEIGFAGAVATAAGLGLQRLSLGTENASADNKISGLQKSPFSTTEKITPMTDVTHYNNYYEFSTDKEGPADAPVECHHRWGRPEKTEIGHRFDSEIRRTRGAHLSPSLCGRLVNRRTLDRIFTQRIDQARATNQQSEVRRIHYGLRSGADAGPERQRFAMALRRGAENGRGHASPDPPLFRYVWRKPSQSRWSALAHCCTVEIWFQERQSYRADPVRGKATREYLERLGAE